MKTTEYGQHVFTRCSTFCSAYSPLLAWSASILKPFISSVKVNRLKSLSSTTSTGLQSQGGYSINSRRGESSAESSSDSCSARVRFVANFDWPAGCFFRNGLWLNSFPISSLLCGLIRISFCWKRLGTICLLMAHYLVSCLGETGSFYSSDVRLREEDFL